jgi:hypothetical protein
VQVRNLEEHLLECNVHQHNQAKQQAFARVPNPEITSNGWGLQEIAAHQAHVLRGEVIGAQQFHLYDPQNW